MSKEGDDKHQIQRQQADQQQIQRQIEEGHDRASNKEITSNDSGVLVDIPQFTSGEGDTAGGQSSGDENQQQSEAGTDSSK